MLNDPMASGPDRAHPTPDDDHDHAEALDDLMEESREDGDDEPSRRPRQDADAWRQGYPYDTKLPRAAYEKEKRRLQIELLKLQNHVKATGERIVIIFEGRDAAGKGGSIKRFTEHLNPRGARVVALGTPTEREPPSFAATTVRPR